VKLCLWCALRKWAGKSLSNVVPSNFVWSLANPLLWLKKSYKGLLENISNPQVFEWHKSCLEGREQVEDEPSSGRPSTSETDDNVERVRSLVRSDRRLTLRMINSELSLNRYTVHQILTWDSRERPISHGSFHQWIIGRQKHSCGSSAPSFIGSQSLWLIFFPGSKSRLPFWYFG
jgi:hypothetical protein